MASISIYSDFFLLLVSETVASDLCCSPLLPVCGALTAQSKYSTDLVTGKKLQFGVSLTQRPNSQLRSWDIHQRVCLQASGRLSSSLTPPSYKYLHHWGLMWLQMTAPSSPVLVWFGPHLPSQALTPVCDWRLWLDQLWVFASGPANWGAGMECWTSVSSLNTSLCCLTLPSKILNKIKKMK